MDGYRLMERERKKGKGKETRERRKIMIHQDHDHAEQETSSYRFTSPIGPDNDGQWCVELNDILRLRIKGTDASNEQFVNA